MPTQNGFMGLLSSPATQGLLAAGLGAMASRGSTMQALGRGGLLGLSTFGQAAGEQQNRLLEMAQKRMREDALAKASSGQTMTAADLERITDDPSKWSHIVNAGRSKLEFQDTGGELTALDPYTGQQITSMQKTLTPDQLQQSVNRPFMAGADGGVAANMPFQQYSMHKARAGAPSMSVQVNNKMGDSLAAQVGPMVKDSRAAAESALKTVQAADTIDRALDTGNIYTGTGANVRMGAAQIGSLLGVTGQSTDEKLANTRQAIQGLAQLTLQGRQQMRGQGQISDNEQQIAERAVSGDISLTPAELRVLSGAARRAGRFMYDLHAKNLAAMSSNEGLAQLVPYYSVPDFPEQAAPTEGENQSGGFRIIGVR